MYQSYSKPEVGRFLRHGVDRSFPFVFGIRTKNSLKTLKTEKSKKT